VLEQQIQPKENR